MSWLYCSDTLFQIIVYNKISLKSYCSSYKYYKVIWQVQIDCNDIYWVPLDVNLYSVFLSIIVNFSTISTGRIR